MESFREALDRLVNQLNRDVLSTIEAITLTELSAVVGKARPTQRSPKARKPAKAPAPVALPKATPRAAAPKAPKAVAPKAPKAARTNKLPKATPAAPTVSAVQLEQAIAFAVSRGSKGVIARQLEAHLVSLGFASGANVLGALAERNLVRDAGFRRATGNGNATEPVFVAVAR
jgi:hypothetical protein